MTLDVCESQPLAGRMPMLAALEILAAVRRDEIVVTTMGAAREWPKLSDHALDLHYIPSAMGQAPALGLGLAIARPERHVIVLNGDGCMLMNLGVLVTIVAARAKNYTLIVLNNGRYEVTGGQVTAGETTGADFCGMARAAKFCSVVRHTSVEAWRSDAASVLASDGPRFIELRVEPVGPAYHLKAPPTPMRERLARLQAALAADNA